QHDIITTSRLSSQDNTIATAEVSSQRSHNTIMDSGPSLQDNNPSVSVTAPPPDDNPPDSSDVIVFTFTLGDYFTGAFLSTIVAMLFTIPWDIIDITSKELEAFYQLTHTSGASARDSLCLDLSSSTPFTTLFWAFARGYWVVSITSALYSLTL